MRDFDLSYTRSFFWWEQSTHWSVAPLPISKVALTRETIWTGNHLHGPEWEHTLLVEEDTRLLLMLFPLHYVQERGRPLVRNLGKICFLPNFAGSWKNSCEHFTFILTLGSTWDMFMDLPPADGSNCQRAWDFLPSLGSQEGKKSICLVSYGQIWESATQIQHHHHKHKFNLME